MEILKRNPFSVIFQVLGEKPKRGTQNFIVGAPGIGKTQMLVHLGIFRIIQGYHIIHVSKATPERVSYYYESILYENMSGLHPKGVEEYKGIVTQRRTIISFVDERIGVHDLINTLENLRSIYYEPCCLLIDGFGERLFGKEGWLALLREADLELWATAVKIDDVKGQPVQGLSISLTQKDNGVLVAVMDLVKGEAMGFEEGLLVASNSLLLRA